MYLTTSNHAHPPPCQTRHASTHTACLTGRNGCIPRRPPAGRCPSTETSGPGSAQSKGVKCSSAYWHTAYFPVRNQCGLRGLRSEEGWAVRGEKRSHTRASCSRYTTLRLPCRCALPSPSCSRRPPGLGSTQALINLCNASGGVESSRFAVDNAAPGLCHSGPKAAARSTAQTHWPADPRQLK